MLAWQWLGTEEGRKFFEQKAEELGDLDNTKANQQTSRILEHDSDQETAWYAGMSIHSMRIINAAILFKTYFRKVSVANKVVIITLVPVGVFS